MSPPMEAIAELPDVAELTPEEREAYGRIPSDVRYVYHESFDSPSAEDLLPEGEEDLEQPPAWACPVGATGDPSGSRTRVYRLGREREQELFLLYNYARYRLAKLVASRSSKPGVAAIGEMVAWQRRAMHLRAILVRANMPLVVAMAKRFGSPDLEQSELVSEGNMALLRVVELFDVSRGFKFSTYACRAIVKSFARLASRAGQYRKHFPVELDENLEPSNQQVHRYEARRQDALDDLREALFCRRGGLGELERTVVLERFAIASARKGRTLAETGRILGLSTSRVRQIQARALEKIRLALSRRDTQARI